MNKHVLSFVYSPYKSEVRWKKDDGFNILRSETIICINGILVLVPYELNRLGNSLIGIMNGLD